jgi:hypothetical protein
MTIATGSPQILGHDEVILKFLQRCHPTIEFLQLPRRADLLGFPTSFGTSIGKVEIGQSRWHTGFAKNCLRGPKTLHGRK